MVERGGYDEQDAYSDYVECMADEAVKLFLEGANESWRSPAAKDRRG